MPSGRAAVAMTDDELANFLETNMKVQVATVGPDGQPHLTTLFYVMVDGQMFFWTYGRSQKIQNLRRERSSARISSSPGVPKVTPAPRIESAHHTKSRSCTVIACGRPVRNMP